MKKKQVLIFLAGILLTLFWRIVSTQSSLISPVVAQSPNLTISAAISLKDSLEEIKTLYQKKDPKIRITYNFGSSGSLQQQIEQGAPVDIFIAAANKQMDALETKKLLLTGSRRTLVTNQLVLITPKNEKTVNQFKDLTKPAVTKIAIGEPNSVPAGKYGEEVLKFYKILDQIKSKIIYGKDVRQILTYVETENVNAGLVYITDAKTSQKVRIAAIAPKSSHSPIVYPIAILKDSKNPNTAKAFDKFLKSNASKTIFKKYGFGTP
jgi:molybdate transport system substrate-binding protein